MKFTKFLSSAVFAAFVILFVSLHGTGHAIEVTNESYCVFCNSYDLTLPAQPRETADYASELQLWMNQISSGTTVTKEMAQSMLGVAAQPLGDKTFNYDDSGKKVLIYSANRSIKAAMWDMIVAEHFKKAIVEWEKTFPKPNLPNPKFTTKDAYSKASQIQQKFREIQEKGGGPDIPAQRNALAGSLIGFGSTTYGDLFRSEGVLENKIEGAILEQKFQMSDWFAGSIRSTLKPDWGNLGDLGVAISTVMKANPSQSQQDAGYLLGTITTGAMGLLGGGATLVFAPAQILTDTFDKLVSSLDDEALQVHFLARYVLATRYAGTLDKSGMMTPEGVLDFSSAVFHGTFDGADPLEMGLLTSFDIWKGVYVLCTTEYSKLCLNKEKLKSAYELADCFALVRSLDFVNLRKELANYSMVEYIKANSFQLEAANKVGVSFDVSIPDPDADPNQVESAYWFWPGGILLDFISIKGPVLSGTLTIANVELHGSLYQKTGVGEERPLSVWVRYKNGMSRRGSVILKYLPEGTSTPPTNQAPVLRDQSLFVSADDKYESIFPDFTDDGDRSRAYVTVTTKPSCGIIDKSYIGVFYTPFAGTTCSSDQFKWFIEDDRGLQSNEAVVKITLTPSQPTTTNTAPVVAPVAVNVAQGKSVTFFLQATDAEQKVNDLVFTTTSPKLGTLKPTGIYSNQYTYTHPPGGSTAGEVLTYTVSDGSLKTSASLTITVTSPPDYAPYAKGQIASVSPGQRVTVKLDGGDEDLNDQPNLVYSILTQPTKGTASISGSTLTYEHTAHDALADSLQWQVKDTVKNGSAKATLAITVVNRQPVIGGITNYPATSGKPVSVNLSAIDPDGGAITWQLASGSPGQISGNTWTHTFTQSGTYSIKVIASDPYTLPEKSPSRTFTVIVDGACNFADVPASHANHTTICAAAGKQWIVGYTENGQLVFKPNQAVTRGEFSKLVFKFLEETSGLALASGTSTWPDVPSTHGLFAYIQTLTNLGLLKGYNDGLFKPDQPITRAEMSLIINRLTGWGSVGVDTLFKDVPFTAPAGVSVEDWLDIYFAVGQLANHGIVSQTVLCAADATSVCFRPNESLTRLESLLVLERLPGAKADQLLEDIGSTTTNGSGVWTDPKTGLTWMRCAMGKTWTGSTCSGTHAIYTWDQAVALTNTVTFAGKSDWRLPNIRELQTIVDRTFFSPTIDSVAFPNTQSMIFWSGSPSANHSDKAWNVYFYNGSVYDYDRSNGGAVRLVRGGQSFGSLLSITRPTSDYVDNGNGTVTHTPTNLTWKRCAQGQTWTGSTCSGTASDYTFDQANALTGTTTFASQSDWRVPTADELVSLVDYSKVYPEPAINSSMFPATPHSSFWSGSLNAYSHAWFVGFSSGDIQVASGPILAVRLVRGGQSFSSLALTVSKSGTGAGTVSSAPAGINCGTTCSAAFASGTSVTLTATPATGNTFTGWSGACSGTGSCSVSMTAAKSVTATFTANVTAPVCTLSANPATITTGGSSTLTASCTPAATSYIWTGGTCAGTTGATCTVTPTATTTYTVKGTNVGGTGAAASATVTIAATGAPVCTLSANPTSITTGGSSTLAATCNPAATSYTWTGGTCAGTTGATCTVTPTATTTYTVAGANAGGAGTAASATVTVTSSSTLQPNADGTVTDPKTGLTWMRCAMGQTWNGSTCTGTASTYTFAQVNALTGTVAFAGQNDWRMPNIRELQTIVDRSVYNPAIDSVAFPNAPGSVFWSGSSYASYSNFTWYVIFSYGDAIIGGRDGSFAVRLVRGGQPFGSLLSITRPTSDYVNHGDGTVTHTPTNLTWKRCVEGQAWTGSTCSGTARTYTFDQANVLTGTTTFAGQSDWRVPTEDELVSLVDYSIAGSGPLINSSVFPATPVSNFWSGSPHVGSSSIAWLVGNSGTGYNLRVNSYAVRLVRGGQSLGSLSLTISKSGTGTGTVSSAPAGISCGTTCSASFTSGASVTLTATPATGSTFTGWSGACTGTGSCTVSMTAAKSVTATFTLMNAGTPVCTLNASPASISVGTTSTLTVTCTPTATSYTWSGGTCAGTTGATCTVTPTATTTYTVAGVNAGGTGTAASATVTIASAGAPVCTLSANPASITAGGSSTLTATCNPPATGYIWTGGTCAGTTGDTCTVKPTATTTYSVQGSNTSGTNQAASATVTVAASTVSYTVPGTLGNDVFVLTAGNNYYGGAGNDTYIISANTLRGDVTAKIVDSEGDNLIQLVDGMTVTTSTFYADAAQLTLSTGAKVQLLGASKFKFQVGANAPAGDTATVLSYADFVSSLGASLTSGTLPTSGTAGYVVPTGFTQASAPTQGVAGSSYTVPGTLGDDVFVLSGGNNYLGGGGNDTYIISDYTLSGAVTAKIIDSEGANVIQLVKGLTIASSSFFNNAVQLTLSNGAKVQILGASSFVYQLGANAPAGETASSLSYAQFAATLGASVPTGTSAVSGSANYVVSRP